MDKYVVAKSSTQNQDQKAKAIKENLHELYQKYDQDGNGVLDKKETLLMLSDMYDMIHERYVYARDWSSYHVLLYRTGP